MKHSLGHPNDLLAKLQIADGTATGYSFVNKFGRNPDIDAAAEEDVWDGGGSYTWATGAETVNVVSTDVNDTSAGTGARTVEIFGLDSSYDEISETITLNGTTNVESSNSYLRLHRMIVRTAGSGGMNAGAISATQSSSAIKMAQINIGNNQTLMAVYTIPNGKDAFILQLTMSVNKATSVGSNMYFRVRPLNEVFQIKNITGGHSNGSTRVERSFPVPLAIAAKSDLIISADSSANNADISATMDILLVSTT